LNGKAKPVNFDSESMAKSIEIPGLKGRSIIAATKKRRANKKIINWGVSV